MEKLCTKFSVSEKGAIENMCGNCYEILKKIDGNCYILCDDGDKFYNDCFAHSNNDFLSKQKYKLVKPIRAVKLNEIYLVEIKNEQGIWNRGRLDFNNNIELMCYSESLEDALESL